MLNIRKIINEEDAMSNCKELTDTISYLYENNKQLREENAALKAENYKDTELQRLVEENARLQEQLRAAEKQNEFTLTEEEVQAIHEWQRKHNAEKHPDGYFGAIGGELSYQFTPTSIGMVGEVVCGCGQHFAFRNLD